ncbi:DUF4350 domain-containing protein [Pengzhenrongella phosphoraccumulans]|uniref:DUF4350 domain-containing protein n=1 Tax=Pengzhenrongella phosphoraccumulans TaxID=3114394 RepID=UPI003890DCB1
MSAPVAAVAPVRSTGSVVVGDGTTQRQRLRSRWQRWRWGIALACLVALVALLAALPEPRTSEVALAPNNPGARGARAVAQILEREGVDIRYVRTTAQATAAAGAGSTLLVTGSFLLGPDQIDAIAATKADLVLLGPDPLLLEAVTDAATTADVAPSSATTRTAQCDDPDAVAAGSIVAGSAGYVASSPAATVCFPTADDPAGVYLVVDGPRRVVALADPTLLTNGALKQEGNAALALRMLGRNASLTWYVPSPSDFGQEADTGPGLGDLLPPGAGAVGLQLLLVAAIAALWRGRRLGRLVTEPLPVTVRAAETTRGRGRLYRRSRSYGHAAAALRAGAATRSAARLGLPRSAGAPAMIEALARATGRPTDEVAALLYGPPPTDDSGLEHLARMLDELESEVHRS